MSATPHLVETFGHDAEAFDKERADAVDVGSVGSLEDDKSFTHASFLRH
jgi:hypothetical protein